MNETQYKDLRVTVLTEDYHKETCGYWYRVTSGAMAHTAFATKQGLLRWLSERGLSLTAELTEPGVFSTQRIEGSYNRAMHMSTDDFYSLPSIVETKVLSNGQYTLGLITESEGIRTVHHLNCNVKERVEFDYWVSRQEMN